MKSKIVVLFMAGLLGASAFGQGTILFNTRIVGQVDAPVTWADGVSGPPAGSMAGLYLVTPAGGSATYTPLAPTTTFRDGSQNPIAGRYVVQPSTSVVVPGVPAGGQATIVMRVWQGASYEASPWRGETAPITITLGGTPAVGAPIPDAFLTGLQGITVPEPATMTLAILIAPALLFWRRR